MIDSPAGFDCFHRWNSEEDVSASESGESSRNLNLANVFLAAEALASMNFCGTKGFMDVLSVNSVACNLTKDSPYLTCRLYGWVQTHLIKSHFSVATSAMRPTMGKHRTRFGLMLFLLSCGDINEDANRISYEFGKLVNTILFILIILCPLWNRLSLFCQPIRLCGRNVRCLNRFRLSGAVDPIVRPHMPLVRLVPCNAISLSISIVDLWLDMPTVYWMIFVHFYFGATQT